MTESRRPFEASPAMSGELAALATSIPAASRRICDTELVLRTPLLASVAAAPAGGHAFFKLECEQVTGSFKARGACNAVAALVEDSGSSRRGLATASTGNHALAVAYALRRVPGAAALPASIYVPRTVAAAKMEALRAQGAPLVVVDTDDCIGSEAAALAAASATGVTYVSPYNNPLVVAGQGTIGLEIASQLAASLAAEAAAGSPAAGAYSSGAAAASAAASSASSRPLVVIVPVGGGGLIAGIAAGLKLCAGHRQAVVIGVQPDSNRCLYDSVRAGRILPEGEYVNGATLADGTAGGVEDGSFTFEAVRHAETTLEGVAAAIAAARGRCAAATDANAASCATEPREATTGAGAGAGALAPASAGTAAASAAASAPAVTRLVDGFLTIGEDAIEKGLLWFAATHHKIIEGAAGCSVALLLEHRDGMFAGCDVVAVLCGSNISLRAFRQLLAKHPDV